MNTGMLQNPGRRVGVLYLLVSIPAVFALIYVPSLLFVHGDPASTLRHIESSESLFRLGSGAHLLSQACFIFVALGLYHLLKGVNATLAEAMVTLIVVSVPIAFLNELNSLAALRLLRGEELLSAVEKPQRDALALLFVRLWGDGIDVASIFWGLWLFPLGVLVYRSELFPRVLGVLLIANGVSYVLNSFASLVFPTYQDVVARWMKPLQFGELVFMFWLVILGTRLTGVRKGRVSSSESH